MTQSAFCIRCGSQLAPATAPDLKPACPKCQWFLATDATPVALVLARAPSGRIVYTRQRGWPTDAWGLVSGYIEVGETAEAAAVREVAEEIGLAARDPHVIKTLTYGNLLLVVVRVEIDDGELRVGSELEGAMLREPDLALTPAEWPAYSVVAAHMNET